MEGAHDGLQHVDRGRRARRHDRARRHHLRLSRGPAVRAAGRRTGTRRVARWRTLPERRRRALRPRGRARCRRRSRRWSPGATAPRTRCRSPAACPIRRTQPTPSGAMRCSARSPTWASTPGTALDRHRGRPRLHRLLHQRPHRGPAQRRRGGRAAARWPTGVRGLGGARLRPGQARRPRREGLDRVFLRRGLPVAPRRLLDVPRHQRRPGGARASAAPPPPTATSSAARGRARART